MWLEAENSHSVDTNYPQEMYYVKTLASFKVVPKLAKRHVGKIGFMHLILGPELP